MDKLKISWKSLYSKYKPNIVDYDIAYINALLFKYPIKNDIQYLKFRFNEMSILSDTKEYFQEYSYKDSVLKLKLLGYIYVNNFKPPPNYLSMGFKVYNIMSKGLKEKQNLIDRNIYTNFLKEKKYKNRLENAILEKRNDFVNSKNFSKSIDSLTSNKNQNFENKYSRDINNVNIITKEKNKIKIFSLPKKKEGTKFIEENIKDINESSIDSVMRLIDHFKTKKKNNNYNIINHPTNNTNIINCGTKTKIDIKQPRDNIIPIIKQSKIFFSSKTLGYNKDKIFELMKNLKKKEKNMRYHLSVDSFKLKLKNSRKSIMKERIDNYWKTNKNFITNLIENNNNIIIQNQKLINSRYYSWTNLSENSKINNFSINYNNLLLNQFSSRSKNVQPKHISLNSCSSRTRNKNRDNTLFMKIQNDSDFMRNKNYSCVFPNEKKIEQNKKHLNHQNNYKSNNSDKKQIFPFRMMQTYSVTNYKMF